MSADPTLEADIVRHVVVITKSAKPKLRSVEVVGPSPEELADLRRQFDTQHWVKLEGLLQRELYEQVWRMIDDDDFRPYEHPGISNEVVPRAGVAPALLSLWVNDPRLFETVEQITGCGRIGSFEGRVYRRDSGHHDSWHDDMAHHRLVTMTINLSPKPYSGGVLQIRDRSSEKLLSEVPNLGQGDAVLFRLSPELQHRVTTVEGSNAKTAFAGWFRSEPDFSIALLFRRSSAQGSEAVE